MNSEADDAGRAAEAAQIRLSEIAKPGDFFMKMVEDENPHGGAPRSITFVGIEFSPLDYDKLANTRLHEPLSIPLDWSHARIFESEFDDLNIDIDGVARGHATLESHLSSNFVSLQRGGWLPSGLAISRAGAMILPDRNVISAVKGRFQAGATVGKDRDFLDMLAGAKVRINPLLHAMEGKGRAPPDPEDIEAELADAITTISAALPDAEIVVGDRSVEAAARMIDEFRAAHDKNVAFLLDVAPGLTPPTSRQKLPGRWAEILAAADRHRVARNSLLALATLSAAAVPNSGSAAKALLKFRPDYGPQDAYNALADIRALEILIHLFALFPDERPAFFTGDRALALFWTGIGASDFALKPSGVSFSLEPVEALFPGESLGHWRDMLGDAVSG